MQRRWRKFIKNAKSSSVAFCLVVFIGVEDYIEDENIKICKKKTTLIIFSSKHSKNMRISSLCFVITPLCVLQKSFHTKSLC